MSQSATNSLALHEIILSIADSLNEAQQQLRSMPPYDEYGRPNTLYQLPYLDFNLEVISQFETTQTGGSTPIGTPRVETTTDRLNPAAAPSGIIRFTPFRSTETTSKNLGTITSNISGRFVAVMPNDGLEQVFLSSSAKLNVVTSQYADFTLVVKAFRADNQPVAGQRIEINYDESTTLEINPDTAPKSAIFSSDKDGYTNSSGEFFVSVKINLIDYNAHSTYVFAANSGTQFSSIAISKP